MTKRDVLHFGILIAFSTAVGNFFWQYSQNIIQNTSVVVSMESGVSNNVSSSIRITEPIALSVATNPLVVSGRALGNWFYDGSFYIKILSEDGNVLGVGSAKESAPPLVNHFIPFEGEVIFEKGEATAGFLLLEQKSGGDLVDPKTVKIPVNFEKQVFPQNLL